MKSPVKTAIFQLQAQINPDDLTLLSKRCSEAGLELFTHDNVTCNSLKHSIVSAAAAAREKGCLAILLFTGISFDPAKVARLLDTVTADWPSMGVGICKKTAPQKPAERMSRFFTRMESGITIPEGDIQLYLFPLELFERSCISSGSAFIEELIVKGGWAGLPLLKIFLRNSNSGNSSKSDMGWHSILALHGWLLFRSLLPWPHRRIRQGEPFWKQARESLNPMKFFRNISMEHNSPLELAAAVWMGIFIGALPIIPFGIATIIYVNHRLHLNKLAGVGASNICVAPFVPLACIEVGHFIRHGRFWHDFNQQTLLYEIHQRILEWLIGAFLVGPLLGFAGGLLTYITVKSIREKGWNP